LSAWARSRPSRWTSRRSLPSSRRIGFCSREAGHCDPSAPLDCPGRIRVDTRRRKDRDQTRVSRHDFDFSDCGGPPPPISHLRGPFDLDALPGPATCRQTGHSTSVSRSRRKPQLTDRDFAPRRMGSPSSRELRQAMWNHSTRPPLEDGRDIRTFQELLVHCNVNSP
jgi:hypothetical protein